MTRVSLVIPVNNEQNNILPLIEQINQEFSQKDGFEVICVEDYSSDATFLQLKEAAESLKFLRIIRLEQQCGQSAALWLGVQAARYPIIVSLDGDGQNDPADIVPMLAFFLGQQEQANERVLVIGHRSDRHDSRVRKINSWVGNRSQRLLLGESSPDSGCGLKIFSRDFFLTLPRFNHMHRFLPYLFRNNGGMVLSFPVQHHARQHGASHYGALDRLQEGVLDIFGVWWLSRRRINAELHIGERING